MNRRTTPMRTDFTAITEALDNLIATLSEKTSELVRTANGQRMDMLLLRQRMADTAEDLNEFGTILEDTGDEIHALGAMCDDVSEKIVAALMNDGNLPTCKYEDFVAICDNCGDEITTDEDYSIINGEVVCAECAARLNAKADEDGDQLTIEISATDGETDTAGNPIEYVV
jgi:uncharacterized protein YuzB (UPF0349 family)